MAAPMSCVNGDAPCSSGAGAVARRSVNHSRMWKAVVHPLFHLSLFSTAQVFRNAQFSKHLSTMRGTSAHGTNHIEPLRQCGLHEPMICGRPGRDEPRARRLSRRRRTMSRKRKERERFLSGPARCWHDFRT
ncbi:hypothetical protein EVAR_95731_1 [Eumeta japonica]|uniref:Uncharacterized protein n=1 Tax=Eumeta variegata TaxID=151549 RepID=A0A4C1UKJ1_EUMVA|nr:hypothetical protein EVAR_95731_1 [Eumeta japonica]